MYDKWKSLGEWRDKRVSSSQIGQTDLDCDVTSAEGKQRPHEETKITAPQSVHQARSRTPQQCSVGLTQDTRCRRTIPRWVLNEKGPR